MKKLMLVAAAAAMTGVAQAKLCDVEAIAESCSVYNVKFTFKTLAAKKACAEGAKWLIRLSNAGQNVWYRTTDREDAAANRVRALLLDQEVRPVHYILGQVIDPVRLQVVTAADRRPVFWMDNATRKFEGIIWQCQSACFEGAAPWNDTDVNLERINFALWEKKSRLALTFPIMQAKLGQPMDNGAGFVNNLFETIYFSFNEELNFRFLGRYGKTAQKVGAYWTPRMRRGNIAAAGFGSFDKKNLRMKSVSGNAVGMIPPITDGDFTVCGDRNSFFCAVGFMCMEWKDWCCDGCYAGVQLVPASGTWSLKYNQSATKKANNDKLVLSDLVPDYMMYATANEWRIQRNLDPNLHNDGCYWIANENSPDNTTILEGSLFYKGGKTPTSEALSVGTILNNVADQQAKVFETADNGEFISTMGGWVVGYVDEYVNEDGTKGAWKIYKTLEDEAGNLTEVIATEPETKYIEDEEGNIIGVECFQGDFITAYNPELILPEE